MIFTENKRRLIPESKQVTMDFASLSISNITGLAEIGVSGQNKMFSFSFVSGRILDPEKRFIDSYRPNENVSLRTEVSDSLYRYYVDGELFCDGEPKSSTIFKYFFVNVTGCSLTVVPSLYAPNPNISIQFENQFRAGTFATGKIINNSDIAFQIFDSSYFFKDADLPSFNERISGFVNSGSSLGFYLPDISSGSLDGPIPFSFNLDTSYGKFTKDIILNRVSGVTGNFLISGIFNFVNVDVLTLFSGTLTGGATNSQFLFVRNNPVFEDHQIIYEAYDVNSSKIPKTLKCHLTPLVPTGYTNIFTGDFVTGVRLTNSGIYEQIPDLEFLSYYSIKNVDFAINNLFSNGCSGKPIPVSFQVNSGLGTGASGLALLAPVSLNLYGGNSFYSITGINMLSGGTGYNYAPVIILNTGDVSAQCFDVPYASGNQYIFAPFSGSVILNPLASYLFAEVFYNTEITGFVTGEEQTYISATGITLTNIGSGYNSNYYPKMIFHRNPNDRFSAIAEISGLDSTGQFYLNSSSETSQFSGVWQLYTGKDIDSLAKVNFYQNSGYSGDINLGADVNSVLFRIFYTQTTHNNPMQTKLSAILQDDSLFSCVVRGVNTFSSETGYLKIIQEPIDDVDDIDFFN